MKKQFTRRAFIQTATAASAALAAAPTFAADGPKKMIGIQVGAVSFIDESVDRVLDIFAEQGAINTVFLATFTYGRGLAGRQIPGHDFPDHGSAESGEKTFYGGNYATPHPEFYKNTVLKIPESAFLRDDIPGVKDVAEVDLQGRRAGTLCLFHPDVRAFWTGLATDLCRSYDIDGILSFNERNGPLLNALGASHAQSIASSRTTCFCPHHQQAAKAAGINFDRAREGYGKLNRFIQASLKGERSIDGYFVEFWHLLGEFPEIMAWDRLLDQGKHQVLAEVNAAVKLVREDLQVGFHIEHVNSFNPIFRATRSYEDLAAKSDFLKSSCTTIAAANATPTSFGTSAQRCSATFHATNC